MTSLFTDAESADAGSERPIRLRDPAGLFAALPVLLGFVPEESLVLVATGGPTGRRLGLTLRVDLPPPGDRPAVCDRSAGSLTADAPSGAAVLVVGDPGRRAPSRAVRAVATEAAAALRRRGIDAHTVAWAAAIAPEARWACLDGCCAGVLPDPGATEFAAAAAVSGRVVRPSRASLAEVVAPVDRATLRRRERLLGRERSAPAHSQAALTALVDSALAAAAAGALVLDDDRVTALAAALGRPAVRDAALVRSAGTDPATAESLWAALTRETPDPQAAEPAALLAACALLRGDGALANVALDRAERARPGHRLTRLLRSVADLGVPPDTVRRCLLPEDPT